MADFYKQLKKAMQNKGITQSELCKQTGINKSAMSQYLSGKFKPKQSRTYIIAKALNVSEAWLMGFENADMERHEPQQNNCLQLTNHEKELVIAYRQQPSMQEAVDRLLNITDSEEKPNQKRA